MVTANGIVTRIKAGDISCQGRPATGVRAQNLVDNDSVVSVNKIVNTDKDDDEPSALSTPSAEGENVDSTIGEQTSIIDAPSIEE